MEAELRPLCAASVVVKCDEVRGQGRPRFFKGHAVKSDKDRKYEKLIRDAWVNCQGSDKMAGFADEVHLTVETKRNLPKSAPKWRNGEPDIYKPDATNILKSVEDALNGVAFKDDAQITKVTCHKCNREIRDKDEIRITVEYFARVEKR